MNNLLETTTDIVEREFYDTRFLTVNWQTIKKLHQEKYAQAVTADEKEAILKSLLDSLGVSHCMLIDPQMAEYIAKQSNGPSQPSVTVSMHEDILVAQVRSFQVRNLRSTDIGNLVEAITESSAIVLDLRFNGGGSGSAVVELASLFLPPGMPILQIRDRLWQEQKVPHIIHTLPENENLDHALEVEVIRQQHWVEYRTKESNLSVSAGKRTIILIDKQCYSCAEVFAQSMKEYSAATIVGRGTAGYVVAAAEHEIGDGYMVLVPFAEMISGQGTSLEGVGVQPTIEQDLSEANIEQILERLNALDLL